MKWTDLEKGKLYTDGIYLYRYECIHAQTMISTVHLFTIIEDVYDEEGNIIDTLESNDYIDSKRNPNFIKYLKEY